MTYYTYVLLSSVDGHRYIGSTNNLVERLYQHNSGKTKSLRGRLPVRLVYFEEYSTRSDAYKREMYFKTGRGRDELTLKLEEVSSVG
jgi:putative endonuclease